MNDALRMELSDCGSPEGLAQIILQHIPYPESSCVSLDEIAKAIGILEISPYKHRSFEGILITNAQKSEGKILYNPNSSPQRSRFTIAHEIGHFLLPFHDKNAQCAAANIMEQTNYSSQSKKEAEANRFAAELLAPTSLVKVLLQKETETGLQSILAIKNRFQLSMEAAANRYIECSDHEVALIFGHQNKIRYCLRTKSFPFVTLSKGDVVPAYISQELEDIENSQITDWYYVDPIYFIDEQGISEDEELYCQSLMQSNGHHISALSFE